MQVLRLMRGYDEYNTILLPPRNPGEKLPSELLDFYDGVFISLLFYIYSVVKYTCSKCAEFAFTLYSSC